MVCSESVDVYLGAQGNDDDRLIPVPYSRMPALNDKVVMHETFMVRPVVLIIDVPLNHSPSGVSGGT